MLADGERYRVIFGDSIANMFESFEPECADFVCTSVPFSAVFSYTDLEEDLGNSEDEAEIRLHFGFYFSSLLRIVKPGRVVAIHCMNTSSISRRNNRKDIYDFRGLLIRCAKRAGFLYDGDWLVFKNPQVEAVRTHAHGLLFVTLERDRVKSRPSMCDFIIKLIAPGDNEVPVNSSEISREEWIELAAGCWHGIKQTDTLNVKEARGPEDVRHVCPLQLGLINRLVRLYSNPDEIIVDPFSGLGSTGYEAIKLGRRFLGGEIKREYYDASLRNLDRAVRSVDERPRSLLDVIEEKEDKVSQAV